MDIDVRLMELSQFIAEIYREHTDKERFSMIEHVIDKFQQYSYQKSDDWDELYEIVHGEDGIWEYAESAHIPQKEQEMWDLETCVLSCVIKLEINRYGQKSPQDMELREKNIPTYAEFLEKNFKSAEDYSACFEYWKEYVCY